MGWARGDLVREVCNVIPNNNAKGCQCGGGVWNKFREGRRKVELEEKVNPLEGVGE